MEQVMEVKRTPGLCQTLVIDTADWAEMLCTTQICDKNHKSSIEDFGYGKGYTFVQEEFGRLLNLLESPSSWAEWVEILDIGNVFKVWK